MRIILMGCCGQMGTVLTKLVDEIEAVSIAAGIDPKKGTANYPVFDKLADCNIPGDILIDFSVPSPINEIKEYIIKHNIPLLIASTSLTPKDHKIVKEISKKVPVLVSQNLSLGIQMVKHLIKEASALYKEGFDIEIIEKHHRYKKDAPSGTALMFLDSIKDSVNAPKVTYGRDPKTEKRNPGEIAIHSIRGGLIPGDHTVLFAGNGEVIEITHRALGREVFAQGAIKAAQFLLGQRAGLYGMDDLVRSIYGKI